MNCAILEAEPPPRFSNLFQSPAHVSEEVYEVARQVKGNLYFISKASIIVILDGC